MRQAREAGNVVGAMTHQYTLPKVTEIAPPQTGKPAGPPRPPRGQ
jgi:hypothetical protein